MPSAQAWTPTTSAGCSPSQPPPGERRGRRVLARPNARTDHDDGIDSAGLRMLAQVAVAAGLKVTVAAHPALRHGRGRADRRVGGPPGPGGIAGVGPTEHWDTAAAATTRVLGWFLPRAEVPVVVSVNVPTGPLTSLAGCTRRGWPPTGWGERSSASRARASSPSRSPSLTPSRERTPTSPSSARAGRRSPCWRG